MLPSDIPTATATTAHAPTGRSAPPAPAQRQPARTSRALTRSRLPGPVRGTAGRPEAESAVFLVVVPLLSIPVLRATVGAAWAAGIGLALTTTVGWLCAARRVVIGTGWVADRVPKPSPHSARSGPAAHRRSATAHAPHSHRQPAQRPDPDRPARAP